MRMSEWNLNDDGDAGGHVGSACPSGVSEKLPRFSFNFKEYGQSVLKHEL